MCICILTAIYSGDYKWFESESEEEVESDSATGSPSRGRSPTPSATTGEPAGIEETGDKGRLTDQFEFIKWILCLVGLGNKTNEVSERFWG